MERNYKKEKRKKDEEYKEGLKAKKMNFSLHAYPKICISPWLAQNHSTKHSHLFSNQKEENLLFANYSIIPSFVPYQCFISFFFFFWHFLKRMVEPAGFFSTINLITQKHKYFAASYFPTEVASVKKKI